MKKVSVFHQLPQDTKSVLGSLQKEGKSKSDHNTVIHMPIRKDN